MSASLSLAKQKQKKMKLNQMLMKVLVELSSVYVNITKRKYVYNKFRSSHPEVFLGKGVLKICRKSTWEHLCRSVISIKLQNNFIEIELRHGFSPVNLLNNFRTTFHRKTSGCLLP